MSKGFICLMATCLVLCVMAAFFSPLPVQAATEGLDVMDFGAAGDGVTDDHEAIQAAIDAASNGEGGGIITFPAGTYLAEDFITLKSNITLLLDDEATIVNGINDSGVPCIVFLTGPFTRGADKHTWEGVENVTFKGGTIDMNGQLNGDGSAAQNLPEVNSANAFALGYSRNIHIENVTFLNNYKGHVMQICACDGVTIKNCTFKGQSLPNFLTDDQTKNLEMIQIESSSASGFPYAANDTGEASRNIIIENCYFGASDLCGEPSVAIGTHSQVATAEKCNHITIRNNTFDNMRFGGIRFCGYEDVLIQGNTFIKKTKEESAQYLDSGCSLINVYCATNSTTKMDLNRRITVDGNVFKIADPKTRAIRICKDKENYQGSVTDITVTNNHITNTSSKSNQNGIQVFRISDKLTITGNSVNGGYRGIEVQACTGDITIANNRVTGQSDQFVRFYECGDNKNIYFYTHGDGTLEVSTANNKYSITAVANAGYRFSAYYKEGTLTNKVSTNSKQTVAINLSGSAYRRHPLFVECRHTYFNETQDPADGSKIYTCELCNGSYGETEVLNVKDFGAVGDGVTDDHRAIQKAIDTAATGEGGGIINFPAGTYLAKDIIILKSNVTIVLDDKATIVNGINYSNSACIVFMTGPFTRGGAKHTWTGVENVTFRGGTIDMNGQLNADGSAALNLPKVNSANAFALGYSRNIHIENVNFLNNYKGHPIQICACDGVTIKSCTFKGQSLPNFLTDDQTKNLEMIQIESSSASGFPYAANNTGEASRNITIENCYFGASDLCGEPSVAIGTHSQVATAERCHDITIRNNTFDNMRFGGIRFCGYEDVIIQDNTFIKKTKEESIQYLDSGCSLINVYCYNNTTSKMKLNRNITIDGNVFKIADPLTRAMRICKDKASYLGDVTDITITNNYITNTSVDSNQIGIQVFRIQDNLTITGNTVNGGHRGIEVQYCTGNITMAKNRVSGQSYQCVRFIDCGDNQKIYFYTHGEGTLEISTADNKYSITAVANSGYRFNAYYKDGALTSKVSTNPKQTVAINWSGSAYRRHPLFQK